MTHLPFRANSVHELGRGLEHAPCATEACRSHHPIFRHRTPFPCSSIGLRGERTLLMMHGFPKWTCVGLRTQLRSIYLVNSRRGAIAIAPTV